ncbi:MAG TPA: DUF5719 family protein [Microbacterium sp.]|uniref:DUF5719 family protein n=1 Tax=Microbacterium sp. TaxID=51671 RepID=UPI002C852FFF|nr:DUF5719 family protein [Microbacterium sp.]HWI32496.1 DUF5719 family protein [Microbacterium sp.]
MSGNRWFRWAATGTRTIIGTAVAIAFTALVVTAVSSPWPVVEHPAPRIEAQPDPADTVAVCAGPALALGRTVVDAQRISVAGSSDVTVGVPAESAAPQQSTLASPRVDESRGVPSFVAQPEGDDVAVLAAASSVTVAAPDLSGFAAAGCRPPLMESWIVGGTTTTGASDILLLSNPGDVTASVQLTIYGAQGPQTPPGADGIIVPAGTQLALPLAGVAGREEQPVVRVTATGAPVTASLQSSLVRTLVPGGLDIQSAVTEADAVQVLAGVTVTASTPDAASTIMRVLAPSDDAEVTIRATAVGDATVVSSTTLPLTAGIPADAELANLAPGTYVITVEADAPVVSAVWQASGFGAGSDYAWYTPSPGLGADTLIAAPSGPGARLVLVNAGSEPAAIAVRRVGGAEQEVAVPAGGAADIPIESDAVYSVDPGGAAGIAAGLTYAGPGALGAVPVWPADAGAEPVLVYP